MIMENKENWWDLDCELLSREDLKRNENKKEKALKRDRKLYLRFLERQYVRVRKLTDLMECLPAENEQIRFITQQNFNAFAIFLYLLENKQMEEVYMTTYSVDRHTIQGIIEIVEKEQPFTLTILLASLVKHDKPLLRQKLIDLAKYNENVHYAEAYNHTKLIAVKTKCGEYYVMEGSGNLSANARIESYLFENSKDSFLFHKAWINDILYDSEDAEYLTSHHCEKVI